MKTIVVKGTDYSYCDIRKLEESEPKDVNLVMVHRLGNTVSFEVNEALLRELTESNTTYIYE